MPKFSLSDKYAIGAALALLVLILLDNAVAMLVVSALGLAAGALVARRGQMKRSALVALVAFVVSIVFAVILLLR